MKYVCNFYFIFICFFCCFDVTSAQQEATSNRTILSMHSVDKQLSNLKKERSDLDEPKKQPAEKDRCIKNQDILKTSLETASGIQRDFLKSKLSLVTQDCQVLNEIDYLDQQYKTLLDQNIALLREYGEDPEFKKIGLPVKSSYSFDEFEELGRRLFSTKKQLATLEKSRIVAQDDLAKRKKTNTALEEEQREKNKQQEEFSPIALSGLNPREQGELVDLQKQLLDDKKALIIAKLREADRRILLIDTHIMIMRAQQIVLSTQYDHVKKALYIDMPYINKAEAQLDKNRNEAALESERLHTEIKKIKKNKESIQKKRIEIVKKLHLSPTDLASLSDWSKTPAGVREWSALCSLGLLAFEEELADLDLEHKEALVSLEKTKIDKEKIHLSIIKSWYVLTQRRLGFSSRALERQIKSYEIPKNELQSDLLILTEKRTRALVLLQELNTTLERIKKRAEEWQEKKTGDLQKQVPCGQKIRSAEEKAQKCLYLAVRLIETYSTSMSLIEDANKRVENVIVELGSKSFWRRSEQSITLDGLSNFIPDIKRFFDDVFMGMSLYKQTLTIHTLQAKFINYYGQPILFLFLIIRLVILLLIFWILRALLSYLKNHLTKKTGYVTHSTLKLFGVTVINFLLKHFVGLYIWLLIYMLISFEVISNVYFSLFFYLISIPYLLFITYLFIQHILTVNKKLEYPFISESYETRFRLIVPILSSATIIIFFFKKSFVMGNYTASSVPSILLTINFIILQLSLMGLISKDWILRLIPRTTSSWEWVADFVDNYYYLFWSIVIATIVMSNPYVGYGRQVLFVLSRIVIISALISLLLYVYKYMRKFSAQLFFYQTENESAVERFGSARTWYGVLIVFSFLTLIFLGILATIKAFGYPITLSKIFNWLHYELYSPGLDELNRRISLTPFVFLKFCLIFLMGLVIAYIINRLLLRYIFDPLLISSGIQNTIFTFTRYILIFITLLIGMKSMGLESLATKFVLVIGAIGFVAKEPLLDFFSYFIILMQRPVKIGDLIMLDEQTRGVVRHMTPRSIILRKDNSMTIIVPNSHIITKPVSNWSASAFLGAEDIVFDVSYASDPEKVRIVVLSVLGANPYILKKPSPTIRLTGFSEDGIKFLVRAYITNNKALERSDISSDIRFSLSSAFKQADISFAFKTHIVRIVPDELQQKKSGQ